MNPAAVAAVLTQIESVYAAKTYRVPPVKPVTVTEFIPSPKGEQVPPSDALGCHHGSWGAADTGPVTLPPTAAETPDRAEITTPNGITATATTTAIATAPHRSRSRGAGVPLTLFVTYLTITPRYRGRPTQDKGKAHISRSYDIAEGVVAYCKEAGLCVVPGCVS